MCFVLVEMGTMGVGVVLYVFVISGTAAGLCMLISPTINHSHCMRLDPSLRSYRTKNLACAPEPKFWTLWVHEQNLTEGKHDSTVVLNPPCWFSCCACACTAAAVMVQMMYTAVFRGVEVL